MPTPGACACTGKGQHHCSYPILSALAGTALEVNLPTGLSLGPTAIYNGAHLKKKKKHTLKKPSEVHTQDDTYRCVHPGRQKPDRLHSIESKGGVQEKAEKDS